MTGSYATVGSLQARVTERSEGYRVHILQEFVDCTGPRLLLDYSGCPLPFDCVQPSVGVVRNLYDSWFDQNDHDYRRSLWLAA